MAARLPAPWMARQSDREGIVEMPATGAVAKNAKRVGGNAAPATPPWWVNPCLYCALFMLPFYLCSIFSSQSYMYGLGQKVNNLTPENIFLGGLSIAMFMAGTLPFIYRVKCATPAVPMMSSFSVNRALALTGAVSIICYLIYFSSLIMHPELILQFFSGGVESMYKVRAAMAQIPGVTSFMQADLPFFSLFSVSTMAASGVVVSKRNRRFFYILAFFVTVRGIMGSERLAIVEAAVAYAVPRAVFAWRPSLLRSALPYVGIVGVFGLFCVGEYFRSWQFYQAYYPSFWDFIVVRFFGYFSTSINNGAGIVSYYPPHYFPAETADGFYRLLRIFADVSNPGDALVMQYLRTFATPEFNNQGGLFVPYMDYGIPGGALCFLVMGAITGALYKRFLALSPFALLLYPAWYLAMLDLIRVWIWGSSRFVPVLLVCIGIAYILRYGPAQPPPINRRRCGAGPPARSSAG